MPSLLFRFMEYQMYKPFCENEALSRPLGWPLFFDTLETWMILWKNMVSGEQN